MSNTAANQTTDPGGSVPGAVTPDYAAPTTANAPTEGFAARSARGGLVITMITLAASVLNFAAQIILAWLLLPTTFGTAAVAVSIAGVVAVLRDAGAANILIERQHEFDRIAGS